MKYEKKQHNFLEEQGYFEDEVCITAEEYEKLTDSEKDEYVKRTYDSEKGYGIEYVKIEKIDEKPTEDQFNNILLLGMYDKISKCEKNIKTITEIMIFFAILAVIGVLASILIGVSLIP